MHLISNARSRAPRRATAAIAALSLGFSLAAALPARADSGGASTGASTSATSNPSALTPTQASALARQAGKAVPVPAATTGSSTLTANPSGTLTLTQSVEPVRKKVKGTWQNLDATLVKNPDGTISPTLSTGGLTLSGGGGGTLATMTNNGERLGVKLPAGITLPTPTLKGDTATYDSVLPGVNLVMTADAQGGFSEVFVIQNAAAAANPLLSSLTFPTQTSGLAVKSDAAGNLSATDKFGNTLFTAPAATMWDSATPAAASPATVTDPVTGTLLDSKSGQQLDSTPTGPGEAAHTASLKATYRSGNITLTPDSSILTGNNVKYPVYVDPTYTNNPTDATAGGGAWTYVSSVYNTTSYYDTATDYLRSGYTNINDGGDDAVYRSFVQLPVNPILDGATIQTSTLAFTNIYSNACDDETTGLWSTGPISSATTWNNQPSWTSELASASYDYGCSGTYTSYNLDFNVASLMQSAATGSWPNATFGLRAADETNAYTLRHYLTTAQITTTYDVTPNTPGNLATSPTTTCTGTPSSVGLGSVNLYANVSSPVGATLYTYFKIWPTSGSSNSPIDSTSGTAANSGTTAQLSVPESDFANLTAVTEFSWNVYVTDGTLTSQTSTTCSFNYDPTTEGQPTVTPQSSTTPQVGTPDSFTLAAGTCPSGKTCSTPTTYTYQLNGAAPLSTPATSGDATISVTPTREANNLTVIAVTASGNEGSAYNFPFTATASATAATGSLTTSGYNDELTVGGQDDLPAGLWLNPATTSTGTVTTIGTNIGALGNGISSTQQASSYTGTQALTGYFSQGYGFNDILDYTPSTGAGNILYGQGDGSALQPVSGAESTGNMQTGDSTDFTDAQGATAAYVANGGVLYNTENNGGGGVVTSVSAASNANAEFPDLLITLDGSLLDEPSAVAAGYFVGEGSSSAIANDNPYCLLQNQTNNNTACTTGWATWQIVTTLVNGLPAMFARDTSTTSASAGTLWYLSPTVLATLAYDFYNNNAADTAAVPAEVAASGWSTAAKPIIQAADFNPAPGLYTTSNTGTTTAYTMSGTTLSAGPAQNLITGTHSWQLNDYNTPAGTDTAADNTTGTALNLTGNSGVSANTGDLFTPDVALNAASNGYLTTTGYAVTPNTNFTVSAWVKPTALGGTILSQSGTSDSAFQLSTTTSGQWQIAMNNAGTTSSSNDTDTGGTVTLGAWENVSLSYTAASRTLALYIDGAQTPSAALNATTPPTITGNFVIGADQTNGTLGAYFTGQVANVQTWSTTLASPISPASGTLGDITGDGKPDVVAIDSSGNLWLYPNTGGSGLNTLGTPTQIGTGWTGFTIDAVADLYHKGHAGLLVTDPSGNLNYYPNTGGTGMNTFGTVSQVGSGWSTFKVLGLTDLYSTGHDGILTVDTSTGNLYYYKNTGGTGLNTFTTSTQVGSAWNGLEAAVGDVNGDGKPDILTLDSTGNMWLYANSGNNGAYGSKNPTFTSATEVSTGWTSTNLVGLSDLYDTGHNGVITVNTGNGNLDFSPNTGGTGLQTFTTPILIGTAWAPFTIN